MMQRPRLPPPGRREQCHAVFRRHDRLWPARARGDRRSRGDPARSDRARRLRRIQRTSASFMKSPIPRSATSPPRFSRRQPFPKFRSPAPICRPAATIMPAISASMRWCDIEKGGQSAPFQPLRPTLGVRAFSSEVETGSRQENASNQESRAPFRFNRNGNGSRMSGSAAAGFSPCCPRRDRRPD